MADLHTVNTDTPLVSVYCMTYNQKDTIAQTIDGVLAQRTDFPFELIIHDDASTDGTADIVRAYAAQYPHIIQAVLQTENQFTRCNLIKTFLHPRGRGQYIALCEGDDYWDDPDKLQIQTTYMRTHPDCTLCFHAVRRLDADGHMLLCRPCKKTGTVTAGTVIRRGGLFCPTASLLFRRDVMDLWPAFRDTADVYDYPAQVLAASMGEVYYIDLPMAVYRFESRGSWTAQHRLETDFAHLENEHAWLTQFDAYTAHRYHADIQFHMAHLWFTEYRKNLDPGIKAVTRQHIRALPWRDRLLFSSAMAFFSVFGHAANRLFIWIKTQLLK